MDTNDKCSKCKNRDVATVPFYVYEGTAYRFERSQKALIIVTMISLFLSIAVVGGASLMVNMAKNLASHKEE